MVTALERGRFLVVPQTAALVASLVLDFAADDVEDESVTRDLLIRLNLDDVTSLDGAPVRDLEALVALREDKFLNGLAIDFLSSLLELLIVEEIKAASGNDGGHGDEDNMRVVCGLTLARDGLRAEMHQQDHVIELEQSLVHEDGKSPEALFSNKKTFGYTDQLQLQPLRGGFNKIIPDTISR